MLRVTWFQRIRVHEAGHAVADYLLGWPTTRIKINRRYMGKGHIQGVALTRLQRLRPRQLDIRGIDFYIPQAMKRVIFKSFAGEVAEIWFYDKARYHGEDWFRVMDLLETYVGHWHRDIALDFFSKLHAEAADWFAKPRYMKAVAAVANALKAKPNMQGREVRRIIRSTGLKPLKKWRE